MCNYLYHILKIIFIKVYILYVIQYAHLKEKTYWIQVVLYKYKCSQF